MYMLAAAALVILFGMVMVMVIAPGLTRRAFSLRVFGAPGYLDRFGAEAAGSVSPAHAVIGGVLVGWGCALFRVTRTLFALGSRDAWVLGAASVGAWFVADTSYAPLSGHWQNALLNTGFLMLFVPPLWATRGMGR
ncbi:hypothetical protein [Gemmatimonas sp.]|jgi:hypothetical protein|uniref:hypothetical protein n=1 Tax=Gemmatimonas sp. TaxID=1962908 RepID=UPI0037C042E8